MDINERIDKIMAEDIKESDAFFDKMASEPELAAQMAQPQDYYQMQRNAAHTASQRPTAYGSPAEITQVVDGMVEETKDKYYNAYNDQFTHLLDANDNNSAQQTAQEYMMQHALPLVASLVEMYGADALLNNPRALSKLDEVMITGNGAGDGFTEAYLRQMHSQTLKTQGTSSDVEVSRGLQRAMGTADQGNVREAVGLARSLKERIDKGELAASPEDYKMLLQAVEVK